MHSLELEKILEEEKVHFSPVVPIDRGKDKLVHLDLSEGNSSMSPDVLADIKIFSAAIQKLIADENAKYAIGGYAELRTVYKNSKVFDPDLPGGEPRRFHLGIDIWGKPYTKVMAPLDGIIHSFAFNNRVGDYGATIILAHHLKGCNFYTLYGHLSLNSIKDKQEGQTIAKRDVFAEFGIPIENGHWPPHLHFQLIWDIEDHKGDYPGVCKYSEKEKYLVNCPDPDLILQLNKYVDF